MSEAYAKLGWFHRYPARFPNEALAEMLATTTSRLGRVPDLLVDPFAGTGSAMAASRQLGIRSLGVELTPLGVLIAQVRLDPPEDLGAALTKAEELSLFNPAESNSSQPVPNELATWIGPSNASILSQWLPAIRQTRNAKTKRWLQLAVSSSLRPSSRWLPGSIKPQTDPNRTPPPIGTNLRRAARALARDCLKEIQGHSNDTPATVIQGDATNLPLDSESVCAIVTSPPYATMYDYYDVQRLTYLAFGWAKEPHLQIGKSRGISKDGVGFLPPKSMEDWYENFYKGEATDKGRALRSYLQSMRRHFSEAERVLRPDGAIAYGVADSFRQGKTFPLVEALSDILSEFSFKEISVETRNNSSKRILPANRDSKTGRFSSSGESLAIGEKVIYAKKQ